MLVERYVSKLRTNSFVTFSSASSKSPGTPLIRAYQSHQELLHRGSYRPR
jgi:hypothetical protein